MAGITHHTGFRRYAFAIFGSMAAQGLFFNWIAEHRIHHRHADKEQDPHSPHSSKGNILRGLIHAHVGWLFGPQLTQPGAVVPDLVRDRGLVWIDHTWWLWIAMGLLLPAGLGYLISGTWGAVRGLVWGGLSRIFVVNHITWSVNSICHMLGSRPFRTNDCSTNVPLIGLLAVGEGWHNNHHAFPSSAQHGLLSGQVDLTWYVIRGLEQVGLAWNVRRPQDRLLEHRKA